MLFCNGAIFIVNANCVAFFSVKIVLSAHNIFPREIVFGKHSILVGFKNFVFHRLFFQQALLFCN